jgi:GT2 family glycosyltransferase
MGNRGEIEDRGVAGVGGYLEASGEILSKSVFAQYEKFHELLYISHDREYVSHERDEAPFETNNISYRKSILEEVGGFDENFPARATGEDGDLKEKIVQKGYGVLFIPVKVTHLQDYNLKRFWRQQLARGVGIALTKKKRGQRLETRAEILLKILAGPLLFFRFLVGDKFQFKFALLDTFAFMVRQIGKMRVSPRAASSN